MRRLIILSAALLFAISLSAARPADFCQRHGDNPNCATPTPTPRATATPLPTSTPSPSSAVIPNDPAWSQEWAIRLTRTDQAWNTTHGSSSVIIADVGGGADLSQPDLQGKLVQGWDFINGDSNPQENSGGHGTATAGIAGAAGNNGIAIATYCWACRVMPIKVYSDAGSATWASITNGIRYAADHGATIITMSFSGGYTADEYDAIKYAYAKGIILVSAGGQYPAAFPEVIGGVGVNQDGTNAEGREGDIGVPFCNMTLAIGTGYYSFCAASSVSPALAGIIGLGKSLYPNATQAQIVQALQSSGASIPGYSTKRVDTVGFLAALGAQQ